MASKKLLNPRGYLSHTQIDMWFRSPDKYIRKYMLGEKIDLHNSGLAFGKTASEALEGGETTDGAMEALVALLPHYTKREHEIRVPMMTQAGSVELLGKLDTFHLKLFSFREYKTGRVPWTQAKANKSKQVRHYTTLVYLKHHVLPPEVWLDWAETMEGEDGVQLTGRIESFPVKLGIVDVLEYMAYAARAAREIDAEYRRQLKKIA